MATDGLGIEGVSEQALWCNWITDKSDSSRSQLFFFYEQWLQMLTGLFYRRYPHPLAEWSDYANLASIGLLQAIDRFNPKLGSRFQSYAEPYVKGNIIKGLSCYVSDRRRLSQDRMESLSSSQGEEAGESDLEQVANVAIELAFGLFLEAGIVDREPQDNNPLSVYESDCEGAALDQCVKLLPANQQQVIRGHYYLHMSFTEISELMGISRSRISQLHAQALKGIRASHGLLMRGERW